MIAVLVTMAASAVTVMMVSTMVAVREALRVDWCGHAGHDDQLAHVLRMFVVILAIIALMALMTLMMLAVLILLTIGMTIISLCSR